MVTLIVQLRFFGNKNKYVPCPYQTNQQEFIDWPPTPRKSSQQQHQKKKVFLLVYSFDYRDTRRIP